MITTERGLRKRHGKFARAAVMIDNNNHTEALEYIARILGLTSYANVFKGIQLIQDEEGCLTDELNTIRSGWSKGLGQWVEDNVDHDERTLLRGLL